jgi:hypothetical protein
VSQNVDRRDSDLDVVKYECEDRWEEEPLRLERYQPVVDWPDLLDFDDRG